MIIRKMRLQRGWSQEQLAQMSGLSVRTIQRIERGRNAGLESLKSLAAVFEVNVSLLQEEATMTTNPELTDEEQRAVEYVRDIKGFYQHLLIYALISIPLGIAGYTGSSGDFWSLVPWLGWGVGVVIHGICAFEVFNFFGPEWERRKIEKRLGKKL